MGDFRELAKKYKSKGFSTIPVDSLKQPTINWTRYQSEPMSDSDIDRYFKDVHGIALLTGGTSKVEVVDIDLKHDTTGDLVERLKSKIPTELLKKLWVQKTRSGGYHWIYICDKVEPNQKLANRLTTPEEKHKVYIDAFNNINTRKIALNVAQQHKTLVTLETRGGTNDLCGGYILISPTPGYEYIYGKLNKISVEERDLILEACRSFNEYVEPVKNHGLYKYKKYDVNPFENYNETGDSLSLLLEHGWEIVSEKGQSIRLRRPGSPNSKSSALYDKETKIFNVFSTSTGFNVGEGYTPVNVFIKLIAEDDTQVAYEELVSRGFGFKKED